MMSGHPVEALLRPAVELWAGTATAAAAVLAALAPAGLMMTPSVGTAAAAVLGVWSLFWFWRGLRVLAYRRNLRRRRRYVRKPERLPGRTGGLFVGRGFEWSERHTQRLHDCRKTRFKRFVEVKERWWARGGRGAGAAGGLPWLHGVEPRERNVFLPLRDRTGHTLVLGTTQVGKTRFLEVAVTQDIRRGETVVVFDPKGDADLLRAVYDTCEGCGRRDDFMLFHLGYPDLSSRYNGVGDYHRVTEVATRVAGQLSGDGTSAAFKEFGWRFVNVVSRAVVALGGRPDYRTIQRHVIDVEELFVSYADRYFAEDADVRSRFERIVSEGETDRENVPANMVGRDVRVIAWMRILQGETTGDEVLEGLSQVLQYQRSYYDKLVASLLPLLEKLTTGKMAALLSPDYRDVEDHRPIWNWETVVRQHMVVYVGLDALSDSPVAAAVGNSMFADLVSYAGTRYKHGDTEGVPGSAGEALHPIVVHADEFNELMGEEFIPLVNKGGAAGIQMTAYSQTLSDIEARLGDPAKARQVSGNFNNLVMFRVRDVETASLLTDQLPQVNVVELTQIAGYTDSSDPESTVDFSSKHEDRITSTQATMLEPHDVMKLPKGEAFALLEGGHLWKVRLPLPAGGKREPGAAFEALERDMRKRYRTGSNWSAGVDDLVAPAADAADG